MIQKVALSRGLYLVDKPAGITSFDVIRELRRELGVRKMGHAGTLDPIATGALIVAVGEQTKELTKLFGLEKEYEVEIEFGKTSDTQDADGKVEEVKFSRTNPTKEEVERELQNFLGKITQMPPQFSAKKVKGTPAYKLARKGKTVELKAVTKEIKKIEILGYEWPVLKIRVVCESGTYMRTLAHDLGQKLTVGALMKGLRRIRIGEFRLNSETDKG